MFIITILVFIFIFGLIVFIHELGHFLAAKKVGIRVDEFAFGFPPRVFAKKRGETTYAINAIPLGGYVKMLGEDDESTDPRAFSRKKPGPRAFVVVAGVVMNIILAWVVLTFLLVLPNQFKANDALFVAQVQSGSAADKAEIKVGDLLVKMNDTVLTMPDKLRDLTHQNAGKEVTLTLRRNGVDQEKKITLGQGDAPLGVGANSLSLSQLPEVPFWKAPFTALGMVWDVAVANFTFIGALIAGLFGAGPGAQADQVSGPIGIYGIVAQFTTLGWPYVMMAMAQLSLAVALFNILPFPALDGGRLLFIVLDTIFRRRFVSHKIEGMVHAIGFMLLIGLFVIITYHDIVKLIK